MTYRNSRKIFRTLRKSLIVCKFIGKYSEVPHEISLSSIDNCQMRLLFFHMRLLFSIWDYSVPCETAALHETTFPREIASNIFWNAQRSWDGTGTGRTETPHNYRVDRNFNLSWNANQGLIGVIYKIYKVDGHDFQIYRMDEPDFQIYKVNVHFSMY